MFRRFRWTESPKGMPGRIVATALAMVLAFPGGFAVSLPAPRTAAAGTETQGLSPARAAVPKAPEHVSGEVLVAFKPGTSASKAASAHARAGVAASERTVSAKRGLVQVKLRKGVTLADAQKAYRRLGEVAYVQPNYVYHASRTPNDPLFPSLWGLDNTAQSGGITDADIDAPEAWASQTGTTAVVVAGIDTGIDYTHPDLAANIWTNPGEIAGNGIDDDHNGYVDDVHGYDFVNNDGDPYDDHGHGTHTAGTIGAVGNNSTGVTGVCWRVQLMGLKFLSGSGSGDTANAVRALDYAAMMGADLTNNSWGGGPYDPALYDAIAANGTLFVAAAGNEMNNNDNVPTYPCSYDLPNIIGVLATDASDALASSFSSYGKNSVDVGAPGVGILSTYPGGGTTTMQGTSMATPHVTGIAALLLSQRSTLSAVELKQAIEDSVDKKASISLVCSTGGRVNAASALGLISATTWPAGSTLTSSTVATSSLDLSWRRVWGSRAYRVYDGSTLLASLPASATTFHVSGSTPGSSHSFKVEALMWNGSWTSDGPSTSVTMLSSATAAVNGGAAYTATTAVTVDSDVAGAAHLRLPAADRWVSVSSGAYHTVAVDSDGSLYAWGLNNLGQLGDGTVDTRLAPTRIGNESDWATASAGAYHTLAIKRDGSLYSWGYNKYGALGDGTVTTRATPSRVGTATDWVAVSAGWEYTIAIKRDGSMYGWGYNGDGEVGDNTNTMRLSPVRIGNEYGWKSVTCGDSHSLAVKTDGSLYGWGWNYYGQIGDNNVVDRKAPVRVGSSISWAAASAGYYHSLGVATDGSLYAWGFNGFLQLGDGTAEDRWAPTSAIGTATDWAVPAAGGLHSLALKRDGSLWGWGWNHNGQLADGTNYERWEPEQSGTGTGWAAISARDFHVAAIGPDGTAAGWGWSPYGQVGDGAAVDRWVPAPTSRAWSSWRTYASSTPATLSAGDGPKTVTVQYRAASGDIVTLTDDIVLDTAPPVTTIVGLPASGASTTPVTFSLPATDALSGVTQTCYSVDGEPAVVGTRGTVFGGEEHTIDYWSVDAAGNVEETHTATFTITRYEQTDIDLRYTGGWETWNHGKASAGSFKRTNAPGAAVDIAFSGGTSIDYLALVGPNCGRAAVYLDGAPAGTVDFYAPAYGYQRSVFSRSDLSTGPHTLRFECTGSANTSATGTYITLDALVAPGGLDPAADPYSSVEQDDGRIFYSAPWELWSSASMSGGTFRRTRTPGQLANITFAGTALEWTGVTGPIYGVATVIVDGSVEATVDLYSPVYRSRATIWRLTGLPGGSHSVRIICTGARNPAATDGYIGIDTLRVSGTLTQAPAPYATIEETASALAYTGSWERWSSSGYSGGQFKRAKSLGAAVQATFTGTGVDWITLTGPVYGTARVYVDGGLVDDSVDLYSLNYRYKQTAFSIGGLAYGTHTLRIERTGLANPAATNTYVGIDALRVW